MSDQNKYKVTPISDEQRMNIQRRSAYTLPTRPTEQGMKPAEIKKALFGFVTEANNSIVSEVNRIVDEANKALDAEETALKEHEKEATERHERQVEEDTKRFNEHKAEFEKHVQNFESHKSDEANPHNVTKSQVGLGNADNTADADKPVSNPTKDALYSHNNGTNLDGATSHPELRKLIQEAVAEHNEELDAHNNSQDEASTHAYIHNKINKEVSDRKKAVENLSQSTNTSLSNKVNYSDIQDNLTSSDTQKPLSAKQGKELNSKISSLSEKLTKNTIKAVSWDSTNYILTITDNNGNVQTIDFPMESVIKDASYSSSTKKITFTLISGKTVSIDASDLVDTYTADGTTLTLTGKKFKIADAIIARLEAVEKNPGCLPIIVNIPDTAPEVLSTEIVHRYGFYLEPNRNIVVDNLCVCKFTIANSKGQKWAVGKIFSVEVREDSTVSVVFEALDFIDGAVGAQGDTGVGIKSIALAGKDSLGGNIYTITYTDDTTTQFVAPKGADGVGISTITENGQDTNGGNKYLVNLTNGQSYGFTAPKGATGNTGATGNGIQSVVLLSSDASGNKYRITFTNGTTFDFIAPKGEPGELSKEEGVYFVDGTVDWEFGTWIGSNNRIESYYDGLMVNFRISSMNGSGLFTTTAYLNINGLGGKKCFLRGDTALPDQYGVGTIVTFVYSTTANDGAGGFYATDYDVSKSAAMLTNQAALPDKTALNSWKNLQVGSYYCSKTDAASLADSPISESFTMWVHAAQYDTDTNVFGMHRKIHSYSGDEYVQHITINSSATDENGNPTDLTYGAWKKVLTEVPLLYIGTPLASNYFVSNTNDGLFTTFFDFNRTPRVGEFFRAPVYRSDMGHIWSCNCKVTALNPMGGIVVFTVTSWSSNDIGAGRSIKTTVKLLASNLNMYLSLDIPIQAFYNLSDDGTTRTKATFPQALNIINSYLAGQYCMPGSNANITIGHPATGSMGSKIILGAITPTSTGTGWDTYIGVIYREYNASTQAITTIEPTRIIGAFGDITA